MTGRTSHRILLILAFLSGVYVTLGQVSIPETSGFGGYFLFGPGMFSVKSSLLYTGPPLTDVTGERVINSIFDSPGSDGSSAFAVSGELNYTFSDIRTQIFFGNRLEDILRLDVPFGIGIRHELRDSSIVALSFLITPLKLKFWEDPYMEDEVREPSNLDFNGIRLRWARMFGTQLEFTTTIRKYNLGQERSGEWLIAKNRLDPSDQPLLNRDGFVYRFQGAYQVNLDQKNIFVPALRLIVDDHKGDAIKNKGYALQATYLRRTQKLLIDANVTIGQRFMSSEHPVYDEKINSFRYSAALSLFIPIKFFKSNRWNLWFSLEHMNENSQVDFFDSSISGIMGGLMYRNLRR